MFSGDIVKEPKLAIVLVLDISGSMHGTIESKKKIDELNEWIMLLKEDLVKHDLALKRTEIAVITFGRDGIKLAHDFSTPDNFNPPKFQASGNKKMREAILHAIDIVESRKQFYRSNGIDYYRPWILLITDGYSTDMDVIDSMWNEVVKAVHEGDANKKFLFWAVGVEGADMDRLKRITPTDLVLKLKEARLKELEWCAMWHNRIRPSDKQVQIELPSPQGWGG